MSSSNNYIQLISHAKLAEYDQTRIDLPIRKYVLINNLLREEMKENTKDKNMILLEQHWFDSCLNELVKEEQDQNERELTLKHNLHLKAFYNLHNGTGFLICTSNS
ncbi:uncharacterized protein EV154DRAFT_516823 [Mucor mucedo]|uniref:uncharacterized protein n=1 Tax=Mucor mucedo TaxID=29922 RepID=UPI00221FB3E5|nr:uncharacterized protein EV154DRAFT_516823 [Mucor mucedo]KAI7888779.1 hypothetical protein EV154DRAFT_516823 [Mucor mucedo]